MTVYALKTIRLREKVNKPKHNHCLNNSEINKRNSAKCTIAENWIQRSKTGINSGIRKSKPDVVTLKLQTPGRVRSRMFLLRTH